MWWAGSNPLDVYLGTRRAAICAGSARLWAAHCVGFDEGFRGVQTQLRSGGKRQRVRLWLSGGLCRPFLVPVVDGVRNAMEAQRIAHAMAPGATGIPGPCEVWVESPGRTGARVAAAMASGVLKILLGLSAERQCRVVSIRPWWSEVLRAASAHSPLPTALSVQDCDSVTILMGQASDFEVATTVAPVLDIESARTAFARAMLSSNVEVDAALSAGLRLDQEPSSEYSGRMALGSFVEMSR